MAECLKWVGNFMIDEVWLSKKINDVIVDKDDQWRIKLFNDIISEIGENFKYKSSPCKTIFRIGADTEDVNGQTITYNSDSNNELIVSENPKTNCETTSTLIRNLKLGKTTDNCASLNDREIIQLLNFGHLKQRDLEQKLSYDFLRAVSLRRSHFYETANISFQNLPFQQYDYSYVNGSCCENVIGYVPVPTGIVGPLLVNGRKCFVPMSTTEGALVASTNRGCRAVFESGGVTVRMYRDGMTRAPVVQFANVARTLEMKDFLDSSTGFEEIKAVFDSTSSFARLQRLETDITGRLLFIRLEAKTGDAMGMNMVSKGANAALSYLKQKCPEMEVLSLSGNYCVDKKASAINWIKGRGKSVVAEAVISAAVVQTVLKTTVDALVRLGQAKLLIGSSMAGTIGGWNAHAANIVAAIFIATGQDVAQMMGCGRPTSVPGESAKHLAEIICSTVLAGELSLLAAQCSNDLVKSHIRLNRSTRCLMTSADSVPDSRHESSSVTHDNDQQKKVRVEISFRDHPAEKPVKFEMQCSNIL
ncbi:unnamed protein product [Wuchereria bancrofti]|uniref:3-hydroxy-3-methylglutaryl-coenzyme A reductase n=1 Tax=Wuchereria bancrofti TaxID=6293 RepID=A0A3P7F034_WUCBA|nr:unnamed protein product [Wuchereria bancrofti]